MLVDADAIPRHCTRCDYALAGLPSEGVCPECGTSYDDATIVLRGHAIGDCASVHTATAGRSIWLSVVGLVGVSALVFSSWPSRARLFSMSNVPVFAYVFTVGFTTLRDIRSRFGERGPPAQLWLNADGFVLRGRREMTRQPRRWQGRPADVWVLIGLLFVALTVIVILVPMPNALPLLIGTTVGVGCVIVVIVRFGRRRPESTVTREMPGVDVPLTFVEWSDDATFYVVLAARGTPGRREVRIERDREVDDARRVKRATRFVSELTVEQADVLRSRIDAWIAAAREKGRATP